MAGKGDSNDHNWLALLIRNAEWLGKGQAPELTTQTPDFLDRARRQFTADKLAEDTAQTESSARAAKEQKAPAVPVPENATETEPEKPSSLAAEPAKEPAAQPPVPVTEKEQPIASPAPALPSMVEAEVKENEIVIPIGNRVYRVHGLARNASSVDAMKVNVLARRDDRFHGGGTPTNNAPIGLEEHPLMDRFTSNSPLWRDGMLLQYEPAVNAPLRQRMLTKDELELCEKVFGNEIQNKPKTFRFGLQTIDSGSGRS